MSDTNPATPATPDRVFIVSSGDYSDYRIESVWTTREAAEAAAKAPNGNRYNYDESRVEEWLLNSTEERTETQWMAYLVSDDEIHVSDRPSTSAEISRTHVRWRGPSARGTHGNLAREWEGSGYGPSPERARKSLADALAQAKAERLENTADGSQS